MALDQVLDWTNDFNADGDLKISISSWDYVIVQLVNPSGTVNFLSSNDDNSVQGTDYGSDATSANYTAVQGINLATGSGVTSLAAAGLVRFGYIGRFLQLNGSGITADKVLVRYFKVY